VAEWHQMRERFSNELLEKRKIFSEGWNSLRDYGTEAYYGNRGYSHILRPAGATQIVHRFDIDRAKGGTFSLAVLMRQREIARYGFPDLFEAWLSLFDGENNEWRDISQLIPVHSEGEAVKRYVDVLDSPQALALGDKPLLRLFSAASSAPALSHLLDFPAPTRSELAAIIPEIAEAAGSLQSVLGKWEESDALRYILDRYGAVRIATKYIERLVDEMSQAQSKMLPIEKRPGRKIKGGRENTIAWRLAELWQRCGLGEPKTSAQSRFIRACSVVLPWHGVHKADVAQFMRGELAKERVERSPGVLIG
jgi:hypothetical protein